MNSKLGKRKQKELAAQTRVYHGGGRGLAVGDFIKPATETGIFNCTVETVPDYRSDRVYVTHHLQDAKLFASKDNEDPVVYVVETIGELEPDGDNRSPGRSFSCERAKITAVIEIPVKEIQQARNAVIVGMQRARG